MKTFLLVGHGGFYNRGCEAIVRCTNSLLQERFRDTHIILSSRSYQQDRRAEAARGMEVIPAMSSWVQGRYIRKIAKLCGSLWPWEWALAPLRQSLQVVDAVLSIGGDNFAGRPWRFLRINDMVYKSRRPLVIWGASMGPFPEGPVRRTIVDNLKKADLITARDSQTVEYLESCGISENVRHVSDPAFLLPTERVDTASFWPDGNGVLGLNVSFLVDRVRSDSGSVLRIVLEAIRYVTDQLGMGVLLIPHVTGGPPYDDDSATMRPLIKAANRPRQVALMPPRYSCSETKHVISQCRFFVGARMHSTIAAISSGVPTLSIAYSMKALGLNADIFGAAQYVVDARTLSTEQVICGIDKLAHHEDDIRAHLAAVLPQIKARAHSGIDYLAELLDGRNVNSG